MGGLALLCAGILILITVVARQGMTIRTYQVRMWEVVKALNEARGGRLRAMGVADENAREAHKYAEQGLEGRRLIEERDITIANLEKCVKANHSVRVSLEAEIKGLKKRQLASLEKMKPMVDGLCAIVKIMAGFGPTEGNTTKTDKPHDPMNPVHATTPEKCSAATGQAMKKRGPTQLDVQR